MNKRRRWLLAILVCVPAATGADLPFKEEETLRFAVNWPSGLSLGEAELTAKVVKDSQGAPLRWNFEFRMDAALPGFQVSDRYRASATSSLCSLEFEKEYTHGKKRVREKTTFDSAARLATRQTLPDGGKSELPIPSCPRDGLTFLFYLRRELAAGRLPAAQTIFFGAPYKLGFEYAGSSKVQIAEERCDADRLTAKFTGPSSSHTFEILVARDEERRPVRVKVPLELGDFTLELTP